MKLFKKLRNTVLSFFFPVLKNILLMICILLLINFVPSLYSLLYFAYFLIIFLKSNPKFTKLQNYLFGILHFCVCLSFLSFIFANLEIEAFSLFRENCRLTKNHFLTLSACVESAGIQVRARHSQENSDFLHFVFLFEVVGILQDQPG